MTIRVVRPGLLTTVQDLGRRGYQKYGVPVGGAVDGFALRVANLLVGNEDDAAALEVTLAGPTLRFEGDALLTITGGDLAPKMDGRPVPAWHPVRAPAGATLAFGTAVEGCRAYLAVAGGIDVPVVLGGRGTYLRAEIGGLDGRALREGDSLPVGAPTPAAARLLAGLAEEDAPAAADWTVAGPELAGYRAEPTLRLMAGAEFERLTPAARGRLFDGAFRVSPDSDRMGYRIEGPRLETTTADELRSEGVAEGTVQLPTGGRPIMLLADRQTTGGYPRIGHVATVDLPVVAQLKPGDSLGFREVSLEEAQRLYLERERELRRIGDAIRFRMRQRL